MYILTGPYDALKSTAIAELAVCVASGRSVFGRFNVLRPGKALIIQNEIHPGVYDERMMRHADLDANWMDNLLLISREDFRIDEHSMLLLDNIIAQEQLTFIALDPLSEMYPDDQGFDENNPTQMTALLNRLKVVRDKDITIGFAADTESTPLDSKSRSCRRYVTCRVASSSWQSSTGETARRS